jgi:osmoprotectant transport system permease protein
MSDRLDIPAARPFLAPGRRLDRLGLALVAAGAVILLALPLVVVRPNRIATGTGLRLWEALPGHVALLLLLLLLAFAAAALVSGRSPRLRLIATAMAILGLLLGIGEGASALVPPGERLARVSIGAGTWLLLLVLALGLTDALAALRLPPRDRVFALGLGVALGAAVLATGSLDNLSILREYAVRKSVFWAEGRQHLVLAFGSTVAALALGLPLGLLCHRRPALRGVALQSLNLVQTIPSIALFGILMVPLGWLGSHSTLAADLGIRGIGAAPALVALTLYALLPVVASTVTGLAQVPSAAVEAARGMGFTALGRLWSVEVPLALPFLLTGVRILLVQSIGLVTVAALIGGGGFGTFVFQGLGQTAVDLVLLGVVPTVALAFATAVLLDAAVDHLRRASP